ncbi:thiamine biosynthesis protein ThiS [Halorubrum salipaludis]|uniref:Thiamine biosynthesis protein ThiS n=1 Tax=Halorubrum salipaludis TaxID=2032630 RepID=A0A2A2FKK5_9EURY|nr:MULTISPECIES: ubiquitin-like small modifier protein 2 [Halorubrum]PAU85172.1 thiamine biosynthesis protein ThiS [Halorubrum salipaludis]
MNVTVEIVGEGTAEYDLPDDATYADLIREAGYHPQEASALVDGSPVPGDRVVDADEVRLLRLIKGGSTDGGSANGESVDGTSAESNA